MAAELFIPNVINAIILDPDPVLSQSGSVLRLIIDVYLIVRLTDIKIDMFCNEK